MLIVLMANRVNLGLDNLFQLQIVFIAEKLLRFFFLSAKRQMKMREKS